MKNISNSPCKNLKKAIWRKVKTNFERHPSTNAGSNQYQEPGETSSETSQEIPRKSSFVSGETPVETVEEISRKFL